MTRRPSLIRPSAVFILQSAIVLLALSCAPPAPADRTRVTVTVRAGMPVRELADSLCSAGVIRNPRLFNWMTRGPRERFIPGRYRLARNSRERQVLRVLTGRAPSWQLVTIPEGLTLTQTAALLDSLRICRSDSFTAACADPTLLRESGITAPTAEGWLFPETYELGTAMTAREIAHRLIRQFFSVWNSLDNSGSADLGRAVILASIVEREARDPAEFPLVASVFTNRLRLGMPLQSCATIEYLLPRRKARLDARDLAIESPYNTYQQPGLPPGPICSPGRAALAAALAPARTDYLYFVYAGNGTHVFSRSFAEHETARRRLGL